MNKRISIVLVLVFSVASFLFSVTPPEKFFGFKLGADYKLVEYPQMIRYLKLLEKESPMVIVKKLGKTTLKNDYYMVLVSSEENLKNLDHYKKLSNEVFFPKSSDKSYIKNIVSSAKPIIAIAMNLHSTEIASSQTVGELIYDLITEKEMKKLLNELIVIVFPSTNPDGQIIVSKWYKKTLGTELEGTSPLKLYHHYAGHDNNRDWYFFNLKETWLASKVFYHEFFPQILIDEHQMGSYGARLFVPPYTDPPTPSVDPIVWHYIDSFGNYIALQLQREGKKGVAKKILFQGWYIGATDDTMWLHNGIGLLFEAASTKLATPVFIEKNELRLKWGNRSYEKTIDFPDPWEGGWWRLRDIVEYELTATKAVLKYAYTFRKEILEDILYASLRQIKKGETKPPYAFVIEYPFKDRGAVYKLVDMLKKGGVKLNILNEDTVYNRRILKKGSIIILTSQPYRPYIVELLTPQKFPEKYSPYDFSTWVVPYKLGLSVLEIKKKKAFNLKKLKDAEEILKPSIEENSNYIGFSPKNIFAYKLLNEALKSGIKIKFDKEKRVFIAKKSPELKKLSKKYGVDLFSEKPSFKNIEIKPLKIGVFRASMPSMDEGWLRWTLDEFGFKYKRITPENFTKTIKTLNIVVFPDISKDMILSGINKRYLKYMVGSYGKLIKGIGKEGEKALKEFIKKGGKLIFNGESVKYAVEKFNLPVSIRKSEKIKLRGSILSAETEKSLYTSGLPERINVFIESPILLSTRIPNGSTKNIKRRVYVRFPESGNLLLSGYIKGENELYRTPLFVEVVKGKGKIILIPFSPYLRGELWQTFKLLFNAILF